jgi:TRAP-type C4-dicarboxylate transport system substrate-binding protein
MTKGNKKRITRRDALKTAGVAVGAAVVGTMGFPAIVRSKEAKRFLKPIVAGLNGRMGDPTVMSVSEIPRILREKYDVELEIQIHPSSTLGTDLSQLEAVQTGFIDISSNATPQFSRFDGSFNFVDLPYIITDWDMGNRLFKSDLWKQQAKKFEANVPVKVLPPVGAGGYRLLWNNIRPLKSPADAQGLKIRSTGSLLYIEMLKNWGTNPTPVPWTETYTALQQNVVDGFHVQPIWTFKFSMYEVLKFAVEVNAAFSVQFQVMNINTWNAMGEEIQKAFMLAAQDAADAANAEDQKLETFFKGELRGKGMEIYTPSAAEMAKWRAGGEKVWNGAGASVDRSVVDAAVALRAS